MQPFERELTAVSFLGNVTENYKDDLRAGAFQYIKNEIDKYELPSPYEVVFCNRPLQPYMCWRYPQPRSLTKLQIYPVPVEVNFTGKLL